MELKWPLWRSKSSSWRSVIWRPVVGTESRIRSGSMPASTANRFSDLGTARVHFEPRQSSPLPAIGLAINCRIGLGRMRNVPNIGRGHHKTRPLAALLENSSDIFSNHSLYQDLKST